MHRSRDDRRQAVSSSRRARIATLVACSLLFSPTGVVALAGDASADPGTAPQIAPSAGATTGGQRVTITGAEHVAETLARSVGGRWAVSEDGLLYDLNLGGDAPSVALAESTVEQVSSSGGHTLALTAAGDVLSWGANNAGQLGDGTLVSSTSPVVVDLSALLGESSVTSVVAGSVSSLALTDDGRIFGWGGNGDGQLGTGNTERALLPVPADMSQIPDGRKVVSIDVAQTHSAAVLDDGSVYGWGDNYNGQLGLGNRVSSLVPTHMNRTGPDGLVVQQVALGTYNSLVRTVDGTVHATGYGFFGQNGTGANGTQGHTQTLSPVSTAGVLDGARVVDIAAEGHRVNAVLDDGTAVGWGKDYLGNGVVDGPFSAPVAVDPTGALAGAHLTHVTMVSNGTYALAADGSVYSWGRGTFAGGSAFPVLSPPLVAPLTVSFGSPDHTGTDVSYDRASREVHALTPGRSPGTVEVTVARSDAPAVSAAAGEFTFGSPPVVTTQPLSQVVESGASVRLEVAGDGDTAPDVLWQTSLDGRTWETVTDGVRTESHPTTVVAGSVVPGNTTSTVDLVATAPRLSVRAVLDNGMGGTVESDVALVRLSNPPVVLDSHQDGGASEALPLVHGLGTPGAAVTVLVDDVPAAEAVVGNHGYWLVRVSEPMGLGDRTITATQATDGSRASATVSVVGHAVVGWGADDLGQTDAPPGLTDARVVDVTGSGSNGNGALAVTGDGEVLAWGDDSSGQTDVPAALDGRRVVQVAAGDDFAVALTSEGDVVAWGADASGQSTVPPDLEEHRVVEVGAGGSTAYAILDDGSVVSWGDDLDGQGGLPPALDGEAVVHVEGGGGLAVALTAGGEVYAWGAASAEQTDVPGSVQGRTVAVAVGHDVAFALLDDGHVVGWGDGANGQKAVPEEVQGRVLGLDAGRDFVIALTDEGVTGWGADTHGQLAVPGSLSETVVTRVTASEKNSFALVDHVSVDTPTDGGTTVVRPDLRGRAAPGTDVEVEAVADDEPIELGIVRAGADGRWSLSLPEPLGAGEHRFTATSQFGSVARSTATAVLTPGATVIATPEVVLVDRLRWPSS